MAEIKFVADVMVGKLARWLRILGFDTAYSNTAADDEILRIASAERRVVLTRDNGLFARCADLQCLFITSDHYREQLQQVLRAFDLREYRLFTRCIECNALLESIDKEAVFERVPPYVYLTQERFATCPSCKRIYWRGTHADAILKRLPL